MPLDPQAKALLDLQTLTGFRGFDQMPVAEARAAFLARAADAPTEPVAAVDDRPPGLGGHHAPEGRPLLDRHGRELEPDPRPPGLLGDLAPHDLARDLDWGPGVGVGELERHPLSRAQRPAARLEAGPLLGHVDDAERPDLADLGQGGLGWDARGGESTTRGGGLRALPKK